MTEQELDLWAERRDEVKNFILQLTPEEAAEVLQRLVSDCTEGSQVVPALIGTIRGIIERRTTNSL